MVLPESSTDRVRAVSGMMGWSESSPVNGDVLIQWVTLTEAAGLSCVPDILGSQFQIIVQIPTIKMDLSNFIPIYILTTRQLHLFYFIRYLY